MPPPPLLLLLLPPPPLLLLLLGMFLDFGVFFDFWGAFWVRDASGELRLAK